MVARAGSVPASNINPTAKQAKVRVMGSSQLKLDTQAGHIGCIFASERDGFRKVRLKLRWP
jgi:hypothetical protein